jgi:hypothetical protein
MQTTQIESTESAIWSRLLEPRRPALSPQAAHFFLKLDFAREDKERMRKLAAKAREGDLTSTEREEIDTYGRVGSLLSIMKSKARKALKQVSNSNGAGS